MKTKKIDRSIQRFERIKKRVAKLKKTAAKAQGALEVIDARLRQEFDCGCIDEARQLLGELKEDEREAEAIFENTLAAFEKKWEGKL